MSALALTPILTASVMRGSHCERTISPRRRRLTWELGIQMEKRSSIRANSAYAAATALVMSRADGSGHLTWMLIGMPMRCSTQARWLTNAPGPTLIAATGCTPSR